MAERILAIDDDYLVLRLIQHSMEKLGYEIATAQDGAAGLEKLHEVKPHLVILDLMMPHLDGWETCRSIRAVSKVPIIILSARGSQQDILKGLKMGADDYLVKPFYPEELQARIEAVLRRSRIPIPESDKLPLRFSGSDLVIDPANRQVMVRNKIIDLTPTEYDLLLFMARRMDRVLPIDVIFENVWPYYAEASLNSVKWYIWRLRRKIEDDPRNPRYILTEHGIGYRFALS
ncbi:MAG: response regulator transcription factor [Anaerolineales bacterium]|nr:response regulator transcription factor [Anaerolineales bacterium]